MLWKTRVWRGNVLESKKTKQRNCLCCQIIMFSWPHWPLWFICSKKHMLAVYKQLCYKVTAVLPVYTNRMHLELKWHSNGNHADCWDGSTDAKWKLLHIYSPEGNSGLNTAFRFKLFGHILRVFHRDTKFMDRDVDTTKSAIVTSEGIIVNTIARAIQYKS